jgi:hypothetical protein
MKKLFLLIYLLGFIILGTNPVPAQTVEELRTLIEKFTQSKEGFDGVLSDQKSGIISGSSKLKSSEMFFVDEHAASAAATCFFEINRKETSAKSQLQPRMIYKMVEKNTSTSMKSVETPAVYFYVFEIPDDNNFVIISGDSRARPVLGYSLNSKFHVEDMPPNLAAWLNGYKEAILSAMENNLPVDEKTAVEWKALYEKEKKATKSVAGPLLKTRWAQEPYYNDLCPCNLISGERSVTGCGATALAQIMKYWNYPEKGSGTHSYFLPNYGTVSADFENTVYNWEVMSDEISEPNEEIARLMFHCGVSMNMEYGSEVSWSTFLEFNQPSALLALRRHFKYKHTNAFVKKSMYPGTNWINLIKAELDAGRPVLYEGGRLATETYGGHIFVCDGYDESNYLHFNWGLGSLCDGYFTTDAIILYDVIDYTPNQHAIIGIEPLTVNPVADICLNSKIKVSPSVYIQPAQPFSLEVELMNRGAAPFEGTIMAATWNSSRTCISMIDDLKTLKLNPGEATHESLKFSTEGIPCMQPDEYFIPLFYTQTASKMVENQMTEQDFFQWIKILVADNISINPDPFENNNHENEAFELITEYNNNQAEINLQASIHTISDVDYYKILFPPGYRYSISSLLHDLNYASYVFDGKYSFAEDIENWMPYQDAKIPTFDLAGLGEYLFIKVEPSVTGNVGSYILELDVTRTLATTSAGAIKDDR